MENLLLPVTPRVMLTALMVIMLVPLTQWNLGTDLEAGTDLAAGTDLKAGTDLVNEAGTDLVTRLKPI
nr:hypothetical protein [Tanacetum cinerariifolium]